MADRYGATGASATGATQTTVLTAVGLAATRARLYDFILSMGGTPADNTLEWLLRRFTVAGTGTAVVPVAVDPGAPAAQLTAAENHSAEPTYTAATELFDNFGYQRATYEWKAPPQGEFMTPATAANGLGFSTAHASSTGNGEVTAHWLE